MRILGRIFVTAAATAALVGCAGVQRSMSYNDVKHVSFSHETLPIGFWIFDRPAQKIMLINQDPGSAFGAGVGKGLTFGMLDTSTPHQTFEQGANLWLASVGRANCRVTNIIRVLAPTNYEARYECSAPVELNSSSD